MKNVQSKVTILVTICSCSGCCDHVRHCANTDNVAAEQHWKPLMLISFSRLSRCTIDSALISFAYVDTHEVANVHACARSERETVLFFEVT